MARDDAPKKFVIEHYPKAVVIKRSDADTFDDWEILATKPSETNQHPRRLGYSRSSARGAWFDAQHKLETRIYDAEGTNDEQERTGSAHQGSEPDQRPSV